MTPLFRAASTTTQCDRLYRQHAASVYRYARAVLGNHADAEDVTQQTFLNAYRALAQGTKPRKAENWLFTIAHNEIRRHLRDTRAQRQEVELDAEVADHAHERAEPSVTDILRALQHLTTNQRSALVMREFEGRSYAEIAEIMGTSQGALETLMFRARRGLAEALEDGLSCAEAELAVSRRLDERLSRREARRLKKHVRDCPVCKAFELKQQRQRSLLHGLSVIPVPASLLAFRGEQAAAAVGGGAAMGAAAGGSAGIGAKAAAVAAAATVAGGVGYTATKDPLAVVHRQAAPPAQASPQPVARQAAIVTTPRRHVTRRPAPVHRDAQAHKPKLRRVVPQKPPRIKPQAVAKAPRKAGKVAARPGRPERATEPLKARSPTAKSQKPTPQKPTPQKPTPQKATPQRPVHEPKAEHVKPPPKRERPAKPEVTVELPAVPPGLEKKLVEPEPEKTKS